MTRAIVFGGGGALGSAIVEELRREGWSVEVAGRTERDGVSVDLSDPDWPSLLAEGARFDGVVWAQGLNINGGVLDAEPVDVRELFDVNVVFIAETLKRLADASLLAVPSRGVVLSSIWQIAVRANKFAYVASKAALAGVVPSIAVDMAEHSFAVNGVLPGVIDTPMTRSQLSATQLEHVQAESIGEKLATPGDVANAVAWLLDSKAAGINGQWIAVDNGWSAVRSV